MADVGSGHAGAGSGEARAWTPGRLGVPESDVKKFGQSLELLLWSRGPWSRQTNEKLWRCRWGKYHEAGKLFFPGSSKGRHCRGFGIKDSPLCHHFCDEPGFPCATEFVAYVRRLQSGGGGEGAGAAARGSGDGGADGGGSRVSRAVAFENGAGVSAQRNALDVLMAEQQKAHDAAHAKLLEAHNLTKMTTVKKGVFPYTLTQMEDGFTGAHQDWSVEAEVAYRLEHFFPARTTPADLGGVDDGNLGGLEGNLHLPDQECDTDLRSKSKKSVECRSGSDRCAHLLDAAGVLKGGDIAMAEAMLLHLTTFYMVFFLWEVIGREFLSADPTFRVDNDPQRVMLKCPTCKSNTGAALAFVQLRTAGSSGKGGYTDSMATFLTANTGKHSDLHRSLHHVFVGRLTVSGHAWAAFVSAQKLRERGPGRAFSNWQATRNPKS
ncbi:hypothetical protein T484DRAFT_1846229 [Baffinella frigidus]|nr:hypothetical protein T484DRAFT_1846229 [Cryptophyta sp. CCMP2293]